MSVGKADLDVVGYVVDSVKEVEVTLGKVGE